MHRDHLAHGRCQLRFVRFCRSVGRGGSVGEREGGFGSGGRACEIVAARERGCLDRGAVRDDLVRIDARRDLAPEGFFDATPYVWHARRPADEEHAIDARWAHSDLLERAPGRIERSVDEGRAQCFEGTAVELEARGEELPPFTAHQVVNRHLGGRCRGERDLDLFGASLERRPRGGVGARVVAKLAQERVRHESRDELVDVVAAERRISSRCEHLKDGATYVEQRDVERSAAEVVDGDALFLSDRFPVRERRCGRLAQNAEDIEPRELGGELGGLALEVVEVRRDRDDGLSHRYAERRFRDGFRAPQDERADLGERVRLAARAHEHLVIFPFGELERHHYAGLLDLSALPRAPDETLDRVDRARRVDDAPLLGGVTDEYFPRGVERHDRWNQAPVVDVCQGDGPTVLDRADDCVARP